MINTSKSTQNQQPNQIAGLLLGDYNGEFIGNKDHETVVFLHNGHTLPWSCIPINVYKKCKSKFLKDLPALKEFSTSKLSFDRQLEIFIYKSYGSVDNTADFLNGELTPSENYRHTKNCSSLNWNSKWMTIDGIVLSDRDLTIIDYIKQDMPDKVIAIELGIALSTFDFHKRNLLQKFNVTTKTALLIKALNEQI